MNSIFRLAVVGILLVPAGVSAQQLTQDQMAQQVLDSARKAFNDGNPSFAATRFREFLARFGGHKEAVSARYGLALALLDLPNPNWNEIRDHLQNAANNAGFADRAGAVYHLGLTMRAQGMAELAEADRDPNQAPTRRNNAVARFAEAVGQFALAAKMYGDQVKAVPDKGDLPADMEWSLRALCDQAEMLLRQKKYQEVRALTEKFLADGAAVRSRYRDLGRYWYGQACFHLDDRKSASKTLSMLQGWKHPEYAGHARYLLARTHHLEEERPEAAVHYRGVHDDYRHAVQDAAAQLKQPQQIKGAAEKARLEGLVKNPPPEHVARSIFFLGVLETDAGKFPEALQIFRDFAKLFPRSTFLPQAELQLGFCLLQTKNHVEAEKVLTPLVGRFPLLADQALLWVARCRLGGAPDAGMNPAGWKQAHEAALNFLRQAQDHAQRIVGQDPDAKQRRGLIQLEMADVFQALEQPKDAANLYSQVINEKTLPEREEEIGHRLIQARHLAREFDESDRLCVAHLQKHPTGSLTPAVLFLHADNSWFRALEAEKAAPSPQRDQQVKQHLQEAAKRYGVVVEKFPDFDRINLARFGLGLASYRLGDLDKAAADLKKIPDADRTGDLATTSYLLADCLLRAVPREVPEDALAAGQMEEQLRTAARLLEDFLGAQPKGPEAPDAYLRLGSCLQRRAALLVLPEERNKVLAETRAIYERMLGVPEFAKSPLLAQAVLERARVIAQQGDINTGINELRRFTQAPLQDAPAASLGLIQLSTYLRQTNRAAEAATILGQGRTRLEGPLQQDPARKHWVALLRYHHGLALRETAKLPEARGIFETVVQQFPGTREAAESALRIGQCLQEEGRNRLAAAAKMRAAAQKTEDFDHVKKAEAEGYQTLRQAAAYLEGQAEQLKAKEDLKGVRARMLYEAAWAHRELGEGEIAAVRQALREEAVKGKGTPTLTIPLAKIPLQPGEKKARGLYRILIDGFEETQLAVEGRFELGELLARRGEHDEAVKLLNEGLDREPNQDLTEKIRLRIGSLHAAKGDLKSALGQFDAVAANPKSRLLPLAQLQAGETLLRSREYPEAVKRLVPFRDQGPFQNQPNVTDKALLRLGQAYGAQKMWNESRQAYERLVSTFPSSTWGEHARYGIGWAWQQQGQFDQAVNAYQQVAARTANELAARAQLQIGLCRLEQKRYPEAATALLIVPYTYDQPELSAAALLEASRALAESKQTEQAVRLLERLARDYPNTPWAEAAQDRLKTLRK